MNSNTRTQRLALVAALLAIPLLTAQSCPTREKVSILTPKAGLNVTYEPLFLEVDMTTFADVETFTATLNGVDISDEFTMGTPAAGRQPAIAVAVWGSVVLPGANVLEISTDWGSASRTFSTEGDPHADVLTSFSAGSGAGFGSGDPDGAVTGEPAGFGLFEGGLEVLSLGEGGEIVVEFVDNVIVDYPGVDFTVFENPFLTLVSGAIFSVFAEPGLVSVSQDGLTWFTFDDCETAPVDGPYYPGCAGVFPTLYDPFDSGTPHPSIPTSTPITDLIGLSGAQIFTPAGAGGDSFDLEDVGLTWARYVRIEDVGPALGTAGTVGFDLDGVTAVNAAPPTDADMDGIPDAAQ
jgi:hypothetical protein